jgi:TonB family protein
MSSKRTPAWFMNVALLAVTLALPVCRADVIVTESEVKRAATATSMPEYPPMARQLKITGKVVLEIAITEDGTVDTVKVTSGNPVLTKPCVKAMHDWKFKPFLQDGKPTRAVGPISFEFK